MAAQALFSREAPGLEPVLVLTYDASVVPTASPTIFPTVVPTVAGESFGAAVSSASVSTAGVSVIAAIGAAVLSVLLLLIVARRRRRRAKEREDQARRSLELPFDGLEGSLAPDATAASGTIGTGDADNADAGGVVVSNLPETFDVDRLRATLPEGSSHTFDGALTVTGLSTRGGGGGGSGRAVTFSPAPATSESGVVAAGSTLQLFPGPVDEGGAAEPVTFASAFAVLDAYNAADYGYGSYGGERSYE